MAYIAPRKNKDGEITSYQVKWRLGGARDGLPQNERFDDEPSAEVFKEAVNGAGQQWPAGWVKGKGFVTTLDGAEADADRRYRFRAYATQSVKNRTGIEEHYRVSLFGELERYIFPTFGECDVRSTEHFSGETVSAWVRQLETTMVSVGQKPKHGKAKTRKMSPKTIRNLHGLLSSVLAQAVKAEPPLRERNPCALTRLPRTDDDGAGEGADEAEDIEFLEPHEVEAIISRLTRRTDQLMATVAYGTGMRWGEFSALAPMCVLLADPAKPKIRVRRAWKKDGKKGYYLGPPKSKRSRRTVRISPTVMDALVELGQYQLDKDTLFFTNEAGGRLHYSSFHDRWGRAVKRAKADGDLPAHKHPTPHDLRHSHAAVLISEGRNLTYVQRRLGHESIKTTSDTYGHLLPQADDDAMDAIERSLGGGRQPDGVLEEPADPGRVVYVIHLDGVVRGFHKRDDAVVVLEQWQLDTGLLGRLETWSWAWWQRMPGGQNALHWHVPERVFVFSMGPTLYQADGTEVQVGDTSTAAGRWVWEWESQFTEERGVPHAEWLPGESAHTEARAYGTCEAAVREAYAVARADALRVCSLHPAAVSVPVTEV
ncbi:site-specific integrase [Streptomyces sp. NPDC012617]|uniref:tyrosine-type recombinase/integrase n=1 Tax=Streptomyces TaxID=1883 RepID=UPI0033E06CF0